MKRAAFALACLVAGCGAAASPGSASAPITVEIASPPEPQDRPALEPARIQPSLADSHGTDCPDQFRRASTGCLPVDFSDAEAISEREYYGAVEARIASEFNAAYGGHFLTGGYFDVWGAGLRAREDTRRLQAELQFFVEQCRAPDVTVRALVRQQSMLERFREKLSLVSPLPSPNPQLDARLEPTWSQWRERTLTSTAREAQTLRGDARSVADQYHVSGVDVPPPTAKPSAEPARSWRSTSRSGCSREAHAELVLRREAERKSASSELLQKLAETVVTVFRLKP